jgi:hypothetical protein
LAFTYKEVLRQTAQRLNAIAGDNPTNVETSYTASSLGTPTQLDNPAFTLSILTDAVLGAQATIIKAICETANHPWRNLYISNTVSLASGSVVPTTDASGKQILGVWGDVKDSSNSIGLTEVDYNTIRRYLAGQAAGDHQIPIYYFSVNDERIFHTRPSVMIGVCTYDHAGELVAIATQGNPVKVPEVLGGVLVSGAVALVAANESPDLAPLAAAHAEYFSTNIALIRQGLTTTDKKPDKE